MSKTLRTAGRVLAIICTQLASAVFGATLQSLEDIKAPVAAGESGCYEPPSVTELQKLGRTLAFVTTTEFYKENNECTEHVDVEWIAVHERIGDKYRFLTKQSLNLVRFVTPQVFSHRFSTAPDAPPEIMVVLEWHLSGTGNFIEYQLYRLGADALEPVEIQQPSTIVSRHLHKDQHVTGAGIDFTDDRIRFGMGIMNRGDSNRFPSGGDALGEMKLVRGSKGLELVPVPESLQLPSESNRLNALGIAAYREKRYEAAANYYRQAMRWNRRNYEAQSNLALAYLRQNNLTEATRISLDVLQASDAPSAIQASSAYNLGRMHESKGERDRALEFYGTAVRLQDSPERRAAIERLRADGAQKPLSETADGTQ